jgi:hypothetical protein
MEVTNGSACRPALASAQPAYLGAEPVPVLPLLWPVGDDGGLAPPLALGAPTPDWMGLSVVPPPIVAVPDEVPPLLAPAPRAGSVPGAVTVGAPPTPDAPAPDWSLTGSPPALGGA